MDTAERRTIVETYVDAYNRKDVAAMLSTLHPDVHFQGIDDGVETGNASGIAAFEIGAKQSLPRYTDYHLTILDVRFDDEWAIAAYEFRGVAGGAHGSGDKAIHLSGSAEFGFKDGAVSHLTDTRWPYMESISFDQFDAWASTQSPLLQRMAFFNDEDEFDGFAVQYHKGDYAANELREKPVTVIEGNLVANSFDTYQTGTLVVTGDLTMPFLGRIEIDIIVGGSLRAQSICVNSLNDYAVHVGGDIICDYFAETGCYVEAAGKVICPRVLSIQNSVVAHGGFEGELFNRSSKVKPLETLHDSITDENGYIDEKKFEACIRSGHSPYRDGL